VEGKISDGRLLKWIKDMLKTPVFEGIREWTPEEGSPQGSVLSPLLANLYLDTLDQELEARGIRFVRYADDFVLLCKSQEQAEEGLQCVREWCAANKLRLHPEKTRLLEATAAEGFDFLGYHFRARKHWPSDYYKFCRRWQLEEMDAWVRMRLRSILRTRRKRKGRGRGADHRRWPNAYFEERELFSMVRAHAAFCESQVVNH